ncbi:uncharacterized protein LOC111021154 [Momordica charantia]|uniref:Uncharacterized protein LOC111021154 n=1 Tax=Momordica charantia TaxID=3673 RepID=A0A6J1DJN8_MOMCH|nr:uncharacterized protein LOC111021154 [Momordica charantia]
MDPMDVQHKSMQYLGTLEIFKESFKIINKNRKIFAMAALCFIHPLNYILSYIMGTLNLLLRNIHEHGDFSHLFSHNWPFFWPFNVFCIIFLFGYSMVSTVAVTYTVAAIYTGREPSPKDAAIAIRKVWKRVLVTFLCVVVAFLVYNIVAGCVFLVIFTTILPLADVMGAVLAVFTFFYFERLLYLVKVLQLSGVVSVLEDLCGFKAMAKSRLLLKGNATAATTVVFVGDAFIVADDSIDVRVVELVVAVLDLGVLVVETRVGDDVVCRLQIKP